MIGRVASLLEVGTGFHEELTGRENICLNGSILGMSRTEVKQKFDTIVEYSGVEKFIDTPIKRYSSGMRLRLGFAVAAHLDPDILIVDEVLSVGDAAFQRKCLDTIEGLRAKARTILFVSHSLTAVENLCDRTIWIDGGQVRMDGESPAVIREYMGSVRKSHQISSAFDSMANRRGNGQIQFTGIEFLSPDGITQKVIRSGDSVVVRMHYCAHKPIAYPCFGFRMYTEYETMVTEVGTSHHGIYIPTIEPGQGYVDLEIESLNLMAAKYKLSLWLTDMPGQLVYDNIEHAVTFEVEGANLFQSGKAMDGRQGIVFFPQKWNLAGMSGEVKYSLTNAKLKSLARDLAHPQICMPGRWAVWLKELFMKPLVSIIVPCYKLAHLLSDCVGSILAQNYGDFEVLIMDNCSPDHTPEVARSFNDPRVKHIRNESNLGHIRNYNTGISLACGKYVWVHSRPMTGYGVPMCSDASWT